MFEIFAVHAIEVDANYRVLVARKASHIIDLKPITKHRNLKQTELVIDWMSLFLHGEVLVVTVYFNLKEYFHKCQNPDRSHTGI